MKTIPQKALLIVFIITVTCSQVSAYSAEAANLYISGRDLTESGNYGGAVSEYTKAVTLDPAYFEAWNGLADALNRDGQFNDALAASNRSLEINPNYVNGWINRGQILYNLGYYYEDVVRDQVTADALYAGQVGAFDTAVSLEPNNAEAWFNKGYALAGMKRYDEAVAAFDRVDAINPSYPNLQKNREIVAQLREKTTPATTGTTAMVTPPPIVPATPSLQQTATPTRSTPIHGAAAVFAVLGAVFFLVQRK